MGDEHERDHTHGGNQQQPTATKKNNKSPKKSSENITKGRKKVDACRNKKGI